MAEKRSMILYLGDILDASGKIIDYVSGISENEFYANSEAGCRIAAIGDHWRSIE